MTRTHSDEWIGGVITLPAPGTDDDDVGNGNGDDGGDGSNEALVWLDPVRKVILGLEHGGPGNLLDIAGLHFKRTVGKAGVAPARVRVASQALASALRDFVGPVEIVVAPTPEVDALMEELLGRLADEDTTPPTTFFGQEVTPPDVALALDAFARLYRAKPWAVLPADSPIGVSCEVESIEEGCLIVVGQQRESFGLSLFWDVADWHDYVDLMSAEDAEASGTPPHLLLSFDPRSETPPTLVREIADHGWTVAATNAYPNLQVFDHSGSARAANRRELLLGAAVADALVQLVRDPTVATAWDDDDEPRTATVEAPVEVTLIAPLTSDLPDDAAIFETFVGFDGVIDVDALAGHSEALVAHFLQSEEGQGHDGRWAVALIEWAARACHASLLELRPYELGRLLFEVLPEQLAVDGGAARELLAEVRALLEFIAREFHSLGALRCLEMMPKDAERRIAKALDDPAKHGPAKQFVLAGTRAGYDMTTREGLEAFMQVYRADGAPAAKGAQQPAAKKPAKKSKSK